MRPDQAEFLLQFLLPQLNSEQAITKKIISSVPPGKDGYQPDPSSRTAFKRALHISVVEMWFLDAVIHHHFGETIPRPAKMKTSLDAAQWYEETFRHRMPALEKLSGEDLTTPVDFIGRRNDPAIAYLNIAIHPSVHHRGQLSAYLRSMGAKVPAIYVESADQPYPAEPSAARESHQPPPAF
jgi:uncharacterized damage-inducible protein DinB